MSCLSCSTSVNFSRPMFTAKIFWMTWFILDSYSCMFTLALCGMHPKRKYTQFHNNIWIWGECVGFWKGFSDGIIHNSIRTKYSVALFTISISKMKSSSSSSSFFPGSMYWHRHINMSHETILHRMMTISKSFNLLLCTKYLLTLTKSN